MRLTNQIELAKWQYCVMISAFLGFLGAVNLLFMVFYTLGIYHTLSGIPSMRSLFFQVYFSAILTTASAIMLICGSYLMLKTKGRRGGAINLLAGTLIPIPGYIYFTFFSQPRLLSWLGPIGWALLTPAIISGTTNIFLSRTRERDDTKKLGV